MDVIFTRNMCKLEIGALVLTKSIRVGILYILDVTTHLEVNRNVEKTEKSQTTKEVSKGTKGSKLWNGRMIQLNEKIL
jgi:hypothetical protein